MAFTYPLVLDLDARRVVVVGGGAVAARKVAGLLDASQTVLIRVVAPVISPAIAAPRVEAVAERYAAHHLDGAALVFAATDSPAVNAAVVADAHARNLLVSRADDATGGDFATPAHARRGPITVAVTAGGAPALAAYLRDRLAAHIDDDILRLARATAAVRPALLAAGRESVMRSLATDRALAAVRGLDDAAAAAALLALAGEAS